MSENKPGDQVRIPCLVSNGAFTSEYLITVKTADGLISGFIEASAIKTSGGGEGFVTGTVINSEAGKIVVKLEGSFFTTTGIARFLPEEIEHSRPFETREHA